MSRLSLYIFRQVIGPIVFFALTLAGVIWLSQSLRMLDLVINKGQSAGTFLYLTLLTLPSLLAVVLPVAFLCACLYVVNRLYSDSELVVMWAAGLSRWRVLSPLLGAAALVGVFGLVNALYLMPLGMRTVKDKVYEIRADLATALVKEGAFSTPIDGLTVYIKEQSRSGELIGIFVHDSRRVEEPVTYIASRGVVAKMDDGSPRLIMFDGNVQRVDAQTNQVSVLNFEKYTFDLSVFDKPEERAFREDSERYIDELLWPQPQNEWEARETDNFRAEGHARLAAPLYYFAFTMIAGAFLMTGGFSRRGQASRIALAAVSGIIAVLLGFALKELAAENPWALSLLYLNPIAWMVAGGYVVSRGSFPAAPLFAPPEPAADPAE